ncbi:AcrR family transcriptional regulator [Crossiella equi]|uniref:AcrR family transcriptional regulator n=1 Tax=Crossiella equi TaxID=130796 RepID=A0ABS5ARU5_9PSEU|nr:TetR/AcrR family transcriptional regulator [Crossiella equi]MBP2478944.1 AcrR family transcriptional regulator [Crossiella equi]
MGEANPSRRQQELLELAYDYALRSGLSELSLRPLAGAIGSSPRVLLYLFGSKEGLIRALLARAREEELALIRRLGGSSGGLAEVARELWGWLAEESHRALLTLWVESYARSLTDPAGPWGGFARETVADWLDLLAGAQPPEERDSEDGRARRSLVLAVLRGALLDLLATGDRDRVTAAVERQLGVSPAR